MLETIPVITVDGPSGSGKGTLSHGLAQQLKWHLLDSGALYRVLALAAQQHSVKLDNQAALEVLAAHLDVQFIAPKGGIMPRIILEGHDVTTSIRTPECGNVASVVAALAPVRTALLERQRSFRESPGLVADGRDMGSVVFPDAQLKIFLAAKAEIRAQRRQLQLQEKGISVSLDRVLAELQERDARDTQREVAPLKPAVDAWVLDTTTLNEKEVFSQVMVEVRKHFALPVA